MAGLKTNLPYLVPNRNGGFIFRMDFQKSPPFWWGTKTEAGIACARL